MSAHDHLNYQQVSKYVQRANEGGGFSVKAYGPDVGTEASNVHMVGTRGRGLDIYPAEVGENPQATTEQGMAFTETREGALRHPQAYWGGWHGGDRISFDVSHAFPRTKRGEVQARRAAVTAHQEAIGTLGPQQEYSEISNPFYGRSTEMTPESRSWVYSPIKRYRPGSGEREGQFQ